MATKAFLKIGASVIKPEDWLQFTISGQSRRFIAKNNPSALNEFSTIEELKLAIDNYATSDYKVILLNLFGSKEIQITAKLPGPVYNLGPTSKSTNNGSFFIFSGLTEGELTCSLDITDIVTSAATGDQSNGQAEIIYTDTTDDQAIQSFAVRKITSSDPLNWQSSAIFKGLSHEGGYKAFARNNMGCETSIQFLIPQVVAALNANLTVSNVTVSGGSDGKITTNVTSGSGDYTFSWADGPTTQNRTGLEAGSYEVTITDTVSGDTLTLSTTVFEPLPNLEKTPHFHISPAGTFRFVKEPAELTGDFQNFLNTLSSDEDNPGIANKGYCQNVDRRESSVVQLQSSQEATLQIKNLETGSIVKTIPFQRKLTLMGQTQNLTGRIEENPGGGLRLFINSRDYQYDQILEITSTIYANLYAIQDTAYSADKGQDYFILSGTYVEDLDVSFTTFYDKRPYDIYEVEINWFNHPVGHYQLIAIGSEELRSEPIYSSNDSGEISITYKNQDNAFGLAYTTGLSNTIRLSGRFHEPRQGGTSEVYRQPNGDLTKVSAQTYPAKLLEIFKIPAWMAEKLFTIFKHDVIIINGIQVQTEDAFEYERISRTNLYNGQVVAFIKGEFEGNAHDVTDEGFILTQEGFIKR